VADVHIGDRPPVGPWDGDGVMATGEAAPQEARLWKMVIALTATERQTEELSDRIVEVLCPDPDHEGPCQIPWALHVVEGASLSKAEQRRLRAEIDDTMHD
ncbi:hypothetical protein AB0C32_07960, partial [Streptosporangium sp. NPDC048865]